MQATLEAIDDDLSGRRTTDGRGVGFMVMNFSRHDRAKFSLPIAVTVKAG
jgi:hypothetical protein